MQTAFNTDCKRIIGATKMEHSISEVATVLAFFTRVCETHVSYGISDRYQQHVKIILKIGLLVTDKDGSYLMKQNIISNHIPFNAGARTL